MTYEELVLEAENEGIEILENNRIVGMKGLYVDNTITLNSNLKTTIEKKCILAEELGHHYTSFGNIIDQSKVPNRKQERKARAWGYERIVSIQKLIDASKYGIRNKYELAEYINVTEEYLENVLSYYKEKYGLYYQFNNHIIYFDPLAVYEKFF
ncbi:ImmA/IrrE family metallo-endopeptidase [Proteiniborus sp. MB09-C3]|uniref:ImmA/IrrE family metallo-endopeptidase n=1 Tax=Proteiniborus sp. MB09-C3 TaxID=3050072 RepID=UPI0025543B4B|nr:ImmA/IrrE family metallo-endopeptidase [Proteiniborus sp. MB09-C3]WIV11382.1 ImmA/IrrE family metallo-endopeptidase [Proteiniborus sp. MB09-C3]